MYFCSLKRTNNTTKSSKHCFECHCNYQYDKKITVSQLRTSTELRQNNRINSGVGKGMNRYLLEIAFLFY